LVDLRAGRDESQDRLGDEDLHFGARCGQRRLTDPSASPCDQRERGQDEHVPAPHDGILVERA
jgi:hypothetical protein